jgi:hypothetical protein
MSVLGGQSRHGRDNRNSRFPKRIDKSGLDWECGRGSKVLWKISLLRLRNSLFGRIISLLIFVGNCPRSGCSTAVSYYDSGLWVAEISKFPVKFPIAGNFHGDECDHHCVASHPFPRLAKLPKRRENGPEIPAFRAFGFVFRLPTSPILGRQLPKVSSHDRENSRFAEAAGGDLVRSRLPPESGSPDRDQSPHRGNLSACRVHVDELVTQLILTSHGTFSDQIASRLG